MKVSDIIWAIAVVAAVYLMSVSAVQPFPIGTFYNAILRRNNRRPANVQCEVADWFESAPMDVPNRDDKLIITKANAYDEPPSNGNKYFESTDDRHGKDDDVQKARQQ